MSILWCAVTQTWCAGNVLRQRFRAMKNRPTPATAPRWTVGRERRERRSLRNDEEAADVDAPGGRARHDQSFCHFGVGSVNRFPGDGGSAFLRIACAGIQSALLRPPYPVKP